MKPYGASGDIAQLILNLGIRWMWCGQHSSPVTLLPKGKVPWYPLIGAWVGPTAIWTFWRQKKILPLLGFKPWILQPVGKFYWLHSLLPVGIRVFGFSVLQLLLNFVVTVFKECFGSGFLQLADLCHIQQIHFLLHFIKKLQAYRNARINSNPSYM